MANYTTLADFGINSSNVVSARGGTIAAAINAIPATPTTIASGTTDVEGKPATAGLRLVGLSIGETAGSTAVVTIRHGTANGDPAVLHISLAANGTVIVPLPAGGIAMASGIWIDRESGTTELCLLTKAF